MNSKLIPFLLASTVSMLACSSSKKTTSQSNDANTSGTYESIDSKTFKLSAISEDESYGYSAKNAIKVGGNGIEAGPTNERKYLNALLGPNGENVMYERKGSCCEVKSENGFMGYAMLDIYEIKYNDEMKPVVLYINMYDPGELKAPKGFTFQKINFAN